MFDFDFSIEKLKDDCRNYQTICNLFLELVRDDYRDKLEKILYTGQYNNFNVRTKMSNRDSSLIEIQRRISLAHLIVRNPETFDVLVNENVNLFHGTNSNALPSILKYGLNSGAESEKLGINVVTGEKWSRIGGKQRSFVSFTDVLDVANDYSMLKPENKDLDFEVLIGTSVDEVSKNGVFRVDSDVPEVGIKNKVALENIKVIGVPYDKVNFVKRLLPDNSIKVVAVDDISNKFYFVEDFGINIYYDSFNKLKENINKPNNKPKFKLESIRKLMIERFILKSKELKNKFNFSKEEVISGKGR